MELDLSNVSDEGDVPDPGEKSALNMGFGKILTYGGSDFK